MGDRTAAPAGAQDGISERCLMRSPALMPTSIPMPLRCRGVVPLPVRDHRPSARGKIHYAAFDAHLIGVDPDYRIHVSNRLLEIHDGPFLELELKGIIGQVIQVPRRVEDSPDRDRLALRFEEFKEGAEVWGKARHRQ